MVKYRIKHIIAFSRLFKKLWKRVAKFLVGYRIITYDVYVDTEIKTVYVDLYVYGDLIGHFSFVFN